MRRRRGESSGGRKHCRKFQCGGRRGLIFFLVEVKVESEQEDERAPELTLFFPLTLSFAPSFPPPPKQHNAGFHAEGHPALRAHHLGLAVSASRARERATRSSSRGGGSNSSVIGFCFERRRLTLNSLSLHLNFHLSTALLPRLRPSPRPSVRPSPTRAIWSPSSEPRPCSR